MLEKQNVVPPTSDKIASTTTDYTKEAAAMFKDAPPATAGILSEYCIRTEELPDAD